jgi:hypothetical protein
VVIYDTMVVQIVANYTSSFAPEFGSLSVFPSMDGIIPDRNPPYEVINESKIAVHSGYF